MGNTEEEIWFRSILSASGMRKLHGSLDMIKGLLGGLAIPPVDTILLLWPAGESG